MNSAILIALLLAAEAAPPPVETLQPPSQPAAPPQSSVSSPPAPREPPPKIVQPKGPAAPIIPLSDATQPIVLSAPLYGLPPEGMTTQEACKQAGYLVMNATAAQQQSAGATPPPPWAAVKTATWLAAIQADKEKGCP